jgi:hypothetical protein
VSPAFLRFPLAALVVFAAGAVAPAQEKDAPRWQFKKDQAFKYLFKQKEVRTVAVGEQKLVATTEHEFAWRWTVREAEEGGALLELRFDSLKATVSAKDFEFAYESGRNNDYQDPVKKKLSNFYDQIAFGKYRLRLDRRGVLTELSGFSKLCEDLNDAATADMYGMSLRDGPLAWFLQQTMGVLPDRPLAQKDQRWKHSFEKQVEPGQLAGTSEFTLTERDKDGFAARFGGQAALDVDMKWAGLTLRGPLKSTKLEGKYAWDGRAGCLRGGEARVRVQGELKLNDATDLRVEYEQTLELTRQP